MTYPDDQPSEWQPEEDRHKPLDETEHEAEGVSVSVEITVEPRALLMMEALGEIREAAKDQPWNEQLKSCAQLLEEALTNWKTVEG